MLPKKMYMTREEAIRKGIQQGVFSEVEESLAQEYLKLRDEIESIDNGIGALRHEIAELHHSNRDADRIRVLNQKIYIANENAEQVLGLISQMESLPSMVNVIEYAKNMCDAEYLRKNQELATEYRKRQEERFANTIASRINVPKEQIETEKDLCAYISGQGKKPEKYIKQEVEKLTQQISINKAQIGKLGFSLLGEKSKRKKDLQKETLLMEETLYKLRILLRTNTIEEANKILLRKLG